MLVLGALGFRDRKETDVLQLICSVSLIAKRSGFSRTRNDDEHQDEFAISGSRLRLLRDQLRDALLEWIGHLSNGFYLDQFDERINT